MTASSSPGTSMKKHRTRRRVSIAGCLLLTLSAPATGANLKADLSGHHLVDDCRPADR